MYVARHSQRQFHGARRAVFTRTLIKTWPMPEFKAYGARRADDYKNVSSLAFASAKSYGARRVPLSPLATEAQNLF
jgi:hypothetical protein